MNDLIKKISEMPNFRKTGGVSKDKITEAQDILRLKFADDYKKYLEEFGTASFSGHELTGICNHPRLNVIHVTNEEKIINSGISEKFYVIEQSNIDGIVIWQSESGEVYQSIPGQKTIKIAKSLIDYVNRL